LNLPRQLSAYLANGTYNTSRGAFIPIPDLSGPDHDGDILLFWLVGNGVLFENYTLNPWYRATTPDSTVEWEQSDHPGKCEGYRFDEAASPMACLSKYQWCNTNLPQDSQCGMLGSWTDSIKDASPLFGLDDDALDPMRPVINSTLGNMLLWPGLAVGAGPTDESMVVELLGPKALTSTDTLFSGAQYTLPDNQWQLDVVNWFTIMLAALQLAFVDIVRLTDPSLASSRSGPANSIERNLCNSQKIRSTLYPSFSMFGLCFTSTTGLVVVALSYSLSSILGCLDRRHRTKKGDTERQKDLEWATTRTLQLQRMTHEGLGAGTWEGGVDDVPVTKAGDSLGVLDCSNVRHPVLRYPGAVVEKAISDPTAQRAGSENIASVSAVPSEHLTALGHLDSDPEWANTTTRSIRRIPGEVPDTLRTMSAEDTPEATAESVPGPTPGVFPKPTNHFGGSQIQTPPIGHQGPSEPTDSHQGPQDGSRHQPSPYDRTATTAGPSIPSNLQPDPHANQQATRHHLPGQPENQS
jgi:hypothetical protein